MSSVLEGEQSVVPVEARAAAPPARPDYASLARSRLWPAAALVIAIGLALRGQQLLPQREYPLDGPIFYAAAIGLFLWGVSRWGDGQPASPPQANPRQMALPLPGVWPSPGSRLAAVEYRLWFGVAAVMFSALAYRGFAGNRFSNVGLIAWLAAFLCFLGAVAEYQPAAWRGRLTGWLRLDFLAGLRDRQWSLRITWVHLALIGITLLAVFFRVHRLAEVPAEMNSDHAETYLEVYDVLHGARPIYFPRNTGHEALKFYVVVALLRLTPLTMSFLTLKVGTVLFSILAVPLMYLLGRELYNREIGLLAAALLAVSQWHIAISRIGLRPVYTPFFVAPTLYFLFRAFKYNRRNDWLASGLVLGAGLHSYTSMRVVPVLLVGLVGVKLLFDLASWVQDRLRPGNQIADAYTETSALSADFWVNGILGGLASLVVFLPLLRFMRDDPDLFWYRVLTRSSDLEKQVPGDTWRVFLDNVKNALLMFNYRGDVVWVNTVPGDPVLNWVTGALFVLGTAYVVWRFVQYADRRSVYLFLSMFVLLLPSTLSLAFPQENPSLTRGGGAVVIAMLLAALPLYVTASHLHRILGRPGRWVAIALIAVLMIAAARSTYQWYFVKYDEQYRRSAWNSTEMAQVVRGFADSVGDMAHAYHVAYPYWVDTRNIAINAGDITWRNAILDIEQVREHVNDPAPKLYLLDLRDEKSLSVLQSLFPKGQLKRYQSKTPEKDFLVFFVPADSQ